MEVSDLATVWNSRDLVNRAVVAGLHLVGIFDDFVDEVAEVEHEIELVLGGGTFVLEDHSPIGVELAFVDVLAADEDEIHRARIIRQRRRSCSADAAAVPVGVGETVPIGSRGLESADQHARCPVGFRRDGRPSMGNDPIERFVFGDFGCEKLTSVLIVRPPSPENDAARIGIA